MPLYYFNAHGPRHFVPDHEGAILSNAEAARDLAMAVILDMASDPLQESDCRSWSLEVTDEALQTVFTVPFCTALDSQAHQRFRSAEAPSESTRVPPVTAARRLR